MGYKRMVNVVGVHTSGEVNNVIVGGVRDVPGQTMFDKMTYLQTRQDDLRLFFIE
ncbi:proline racemase family protein [Acerihabitans sp. KWT182]|uniref:Proline racemase family protein n=1 Tax=Acerihabitans sp. KWT182 TaxID=3157919 RepID=A0AAU7QAT3_9GAMM